MEKFNTSDVHSRQLEYLAVFLVFGAYLGVRVIVWNNTTLLDDHDSTSILQWAIPFFELDIRGIASLHPDASLVAPFLTALFSVPGWSFEHGARLAVLFSSVVLFFSVYGIGRQIAGGAAIVVGLLFLTFNPEMVPLSVAVLTEPIYIATIYVGLYIFWLQFRDPTVLGAVVLGLVFGVGFLNRLEGIVFIAFVPLMLGIYYAMHRPDNLSIARVLGWSAVFGSVFLFFMGLQVWRVSAEMGALAINGRQAWTLLLHSPAVGDTRLERIYGLYFDPGTVNIAYLIQNFGAASSITSGYGSVGEIFGNYARTLIANVYDLYLHRVNRLFGPLVILFFAVGLFQLYRTERKYEVTLIVMFLGFALVAPLLHNVVIRHIAVIAPIVLLVAGVGVVATGKALCGVMWANRGVWVALLTVGITLVTIMGWALPLRGALNPPETNREYDLVELQEPIRIIGEAVAERPRDQPRVIARRTYLALLSGAAVRSMPYTDYAGLVRYSALNDVDFIYINREVHRFPFFEVFSVGGETEYFEVVYRGTDAEGEATALYRFHPER